MPYTISRIMGDNMDRKKIIYIGSLLVITVIISIASFSYAIWSNKSEQRGKLNIVAGTLNYEIESDDLDINKSISMPANSVKEISVRVTSLNEIDSKYGLYYQTDNSDIKVYYRYENIKEPIDEIDKRSHVTLQLVVVNSSTTAGTVSFDINGGFEGKTLDIIENYENIEKRAMADNIGYDEPNDFGCTDVACMINALDNAIENGA